MLKKPIYLIGMPASGKSKLGKALAKHYRVPFIDLDQLIEIESGKSIAAIIESEGEDLFRQIEHSCLLKALSATHIYICACGGGTPCYYNNMELMRLSSYTIYLNISELKLLKRLQESPNTQRPQWKNMNPEELKKQLQTLISRRKLIYETAETQVLLVDNYKSDLMKLIEVIESENCN